MRFLCSDACKQNKKIDIQWMISSGHSIALTVLKNIPFVMPKILYTVKPLIEPPPP